MRIILTECGLIIMNKKIVEYEYDLIITELARKKNLRTNKLRYLKYKTKYLELKNRQN